MRAIARLSAFTSAEDAKFYDHHGFDPTQIALVSVTLRGQTRSNTRALGATLAGARHADSTIVAVALRNR